MEPMTEWQMTLAARKDARAAVSSVRYGSPWWLALSVSAAWGLLVFATFGANETAGAGWAAVTLLLVLPFPLFVTAWSFAAWGVELGRLDTYRALLGLPELPAREEPEPEPEPEPAVGLRPGLEVNGEIVSPSGDGAPGAGMLRAKCLRLVRAGQQRGGYSRSRIAEGPRKLMSGDDWSEASKELQRLNFFGNSPAGLVPLRPIDDILARLEAAR